MNMNKDRSLPLSMLTLAIGLSLSLSLTYQAEAQHTLTMNSSHPLVGSLVAGSDTRLVPQHLAAADLSTTVSAATEPFLTIQNNRISAWLENRPLSWVLQEVGAQSHVSIIKTDANAAMFDTIPVTVRFKDLPLDQGVQMLLKEVDAFYFYQAGGQVAAMLQTVWVYPKGQGETMQLVSSTVDTVDPTQELRANLYHADPAQRIAALKAMITHKGAQAEPYILDALEDFDASVRLHALQGAFRASIDLPVNLLSYLLQYDTFPQVRFLALHAIARDPDTNRWLIELALGDADERVQSQAQTLLDSMVVDSEDDHAHEEDEGHH